MGETIHPWRARLVVAVVALGVLLLGPTPYPRAFASAMRQAETHRSTREYSAALNAYQEAARLDPESALPWLQMGEVLLAQHRFLPATAAFREAERLGDDGTALLGLGESYAGRSDWAAAIHTWLRAQALAPQDARVYVALGRGFMAQGEFDLAEHYLSEAHRLDPAPHDAATAHALLGRLCVAESPAQAADHFRQAGDQDMLAVLEAAAREGSTETDSARRALLLGAAFLQREELALARYHFERAVSLDPTDVEPRAYLAHTLDRLGETVAAGEMLAQALEMEPDSSLAYYFLGVHHRLVGNVERAQAALWEALTRDPENAALRVEMAEAFVDLGDYPLAEEWYQGAVDVASQDVEFHLLLVRFYVDHLYRVEEAGIPAAEAVVALAPDDARAYDLLGWAYHLAGRSVEATGALHQALALDPNLVSAHYRLGNAYLYAGQHTLARRHLQRAADLDTGGYYRRRAEAALSELE